MPATDCHVPSRRQRDLHYFRNPQLWAAWPFLPVVRQLESGERQLGVLFDARTKLGICGFSSTVFKVNVFMLPPTPEALLESPRCVYDTPEEIADDGWTVD